MGVHFFCTDDIIEFDDAEVVVEFSAKIQYYEDTDS